MKKLYVLIPFLACMLGAQAGGFKVGLQGQKQIGMAHIGIGFAQDASVIYFNPAAMPFVENQIGFGISALVPRTQFLDARTNISYNAVNQTFTPFSLYANYKIKNTPLNVGLGIYTPFGSGIRYQNDWTGRFVLTNIELQTVFFQPTVACKISDNFSLAASAIYAAGNMLLEKNIPLQTPNQEGHAALSGKADGWGFSVASFFKLNKAFSGGITYHSKVRMRVDHGSAQFSNIPGSLSSSFPNTTFSSELPLPSELGMGFAHKLHKDFTLALDLNYTFWNSYKYLQFDYADNTSVLTDDPSFRNYENAFAIRFGGQYEVNSRFSLRAGAFYDQTPVQNGYVAPELPDNDKTGFSLGTTIWLENRISLDASLMYEDVARRSDTNIESNLAGTYKTKVIIPGIGINYLFNKKVQNRLKTF